MSNRYDAAEEIVSRLQGEIEAEVPYPGPIGEILNIMRRAIRAGRGMEREACAGLVENWANDPWQPFGAYRASIAAAIRARGNGEKL